MAKRTYGKGSAVYLAIAVVIMVVLEMTVFGTRPPQRQQQATITIEDEQPAPESIPEGEGALSRKPDFAPPRTLETIEPLLPGSTAYGEKFGPVLPPAWVRNAVPSNVPQGKPRVAVIIDDMGMDRKHTRAAITLPGPLTMAFLPYADDLPAQTGEARAEGHELLVHVPMAPVRNTEGAGPDVLTPEMTPEDFMAMLDKDLSAFSGYVGINNHMGSKMTQDRPGMERVMAELRARGLLFIDSRTINTSVAADEAAKAGIPYAVRDVFLDHEETYEAVAGTLAEVERKALKDGLAIAIGHPREETVKALREWLPTLEAKGIALVPVSAIVTAPPEGNPE
ncbi:MAG: divergent polysaccharide deacetylase family protein [Micavibrio aeruginosavorus]|nr:divergent polysaccharide deacetylase family protein [Micavibrio aeruginosavorus]